MLPGMPQVNVRLPDIVVEAVRREQHRNMLRSGQKAYVELLLDVLVQRGQASQEEADQILLTEGITPPTSSSSRTSQRSSD